MLLEAKNIVKKYQNHIALDDVSIEIEEGKVFGLLGPNGAGKTTLIRNINQIIIPDSGQIFFDGERLMPKHVAQIGYMPEERGLYKNMKVGEQAMYLAQLKGMPQSEAKKKIRYWFEKFDISDWWNKTIDELSKGMAQKVQFITTVVHEPKLLIFDEPFSGFDPVNAQIIKDEILELKNKGATILFSTHRMESVEEMCDHIALINNSKKVLEGDLAQVKRMFWDNVYEVTVNASDMDNLSKLDNLVSIKNVSDNKNFSDQKVVTLKLLAGIESKDLLKNLVSNFDVHHFSEKIPSINEIFINQVENSK